MAYTGKLTRLHNRCLLWLELSAMASFIVTDKVNELKRYDQEKDWSKPIRFMNRREDFTKMIKRYSELSQWLYMRYVNTLSEINIEAANRIMQSINHNQTETTPS